MFEREKLESYIKEWKETGENKFEKQIYHFDFRIEKDDGAFLLFIENLEFVSELIFLCTCDKLAPVNILQSKLFQLFQNIEKSNFPDNYTPFFSLNDLSGYNVGVMISNEKDGDMIDLIKECAHYHIKKAIENQSTNWMLADIFMNVLKMTFFI